MLLRSMFYDQILFALLVLLTISGSKNSTPKTFQEESNNAIFYTAITMRVLATLLTTSLVVTTSEAFAPSAFVRPSSTRIFVTIDNKVDTSDAIRVAKEASEKFGATSAEARIAWEDVEEIDASNRYESKQVELARSLCIKHPHQLLLGATQ